MPTTLWIWDIQKLRQAICVIQEEPIKCESIGDPVREHGCWGQPDVSVAIIYLIVKLLLGQRKGGF